jgi:hypothetical protein
VDRSSTIVELDAPSRDRVGDSLMAMFSLDVTP